MRKKKGSVVTILALVVFCTGCAGHLSDVTNTPVGATTDTNTVPQTATTSTTITTASPTTTYMAPLTAIQTEKTTATTKKKTKKPTIVTTRSSTTTNSKPKYQTTTTKFKYYMPTEKWEKIKIKTFTFDYESEDYECFYDLVAKYCDEPNLKEYQVEKTVFSEDIDPETGERGVTAFYLELNRYINDCRTENVYKLLLEENDGVYETDTLSCWIDHYDSKKVKPPRKPTSEEEKAALKSERKRVQKEIDCQWPDAGFVVLEQEVEYVYNIERDYNYFVVQTTYGRPNGGRGGMSAQFEIKR